MKHFKFNEVAPKDVTNFGSHGTKIRVFIEEAEAPNFIMRRFDLEPGGIIGLHDHPWEHEMYVIEGELFLTDKEGNKAKVTKNEFIYMPPNEPHGYINNSNENAAFICIIPKEKT